MKSKKKTIFMTCILLMVCTFIIPMTASAKKYYSMEKLGVPGYVGAPYYQIRSWKGNTITYRKYDTSTSSKKPKTGKWKKAKITSKTKYYVGDAKHFNKVVNRYVDKDGYYYPSEVKFVVKSSKAKFKKYYRGKSRIRVDLVIKKGKVKTVIYKSKVDA